MLPAPMRLAAADVSGGGPRFQAFIEQDLASNHLVACRRVAGKIDAADEELLAFLGGKCQVNLVSAWEIELRLDHDFAHLVDEPVFVAHAHIGEPAVERERTVELRLDDDLALRVDITVLAGDIVADAHGRQAFGEGTR